MVCSWDFEYYTFDHTIKSTKSIILQLNQTQNQKRWFYFSLQAWGYLPILFSSSLLYSKQDLEGRLNNTKKNIIYKQWWKGNSVHIFVPLLSFSLFIISLSFLEGEKKREIESNGDKKMHRAPFHHKQYTNNLYIVLKPFLQKRNILFNKTWWYKLKTVNFLLKYSLKGFLNIWEFNGSLKNSFANSFSFSLSLFFIWGKRKGR